MKNQEQLNSLVSEENTTKETWNAPQLESIGVEFTEANFGTRFDGITSS